jgi:hypothetical protein
MADETKGVSDRAARLVARIVAVVDEEHLQLDDTELLLSAALLTCAEDYNISADHANGELAAGLLCRSSTSAYIGMKSLVHKVGGSNEAKFKLAALVLAPAGVTQEAQSVKVEMRQVANILPQFGEWLAALHEGSTDRPLH